MSCLHQDAPTMGAVAVSKKKLNEAKENERLFEFLMGLYNDFSVTKTQILTSQPIPNLSNACHLVGEDERQRAISLEKKP